MVTKFHDYKYERPDLQQISKEVSELIEKFNAADSAKAQSKVVDELNKIFNHLDTMETLANIRASIDTKDEFYDTERNFFDEYDPVITEINNKYYDAILNSDFRFELEDLYGRQLFALAEN